MSIHESSPDTIKGSYSNDLVLSKLWACKKLQELDLTVFDNVYILGSWYGNMSLFLLTQHIEFKKCYNIDWDYEKTENVAHMLKRMHMNHTIRAVRGDVNELVYAGDRILVINTSTNDISGLNWLYNIPAGSTVLLQGKDHQELSNGIETLEKFNRVYKLDKTLFLDALPLEDVKGNAYLRFMKIGIV